MDERLPGTACEGDEARLIATLLSPEEHRRAQRLRTAVQARRWCRVRARLRQLLSERCGEPAAGLRFIAGRHGKPLLAPPASAEKPVAPMHGWRFNVSHTGQQALIGLSSSGELGVDIERIGRTRDTEALLEAVLNAAERDAFARRTPDERAALFTRIWVRKEAFVKAIGIGIGFGLTRVHVGCGPVPRLRTDDDPAPPWHLSDLDAPIGYRAALCHAA